MATILDVGVLNYFVPILVLIFVFVILYGIFEKTNLFGDQKGLHALVAILFALLFIIVKPLRELIVTITPWFILLFFLIFIILMAIMMFGFKESDITSYLSGNPGVTTTVVIVVLLIFLLGVRAVFPGSLGFPTDSVGSGGFRRVLFNPKVLGFLLIFAIAYFVVRAVGFGKK